MFLLLLLVFGIVLYFSMKSFQNTEGVISSFTIFAVTFIFYNLLIPIECYFFDDYFIPGSIGGVKASYTDICLIMFFNILAIIGFALGYKLSGFNPFKWGGDAIKHKRLPIGHIFIGIISILLILTVFRSNFQSSASYEGSYLTRYQNPIFSLLLSCFLFFLGITIGYLILVKRRIGTFVVIFAIIGILVGLFTSSKSQILIALSGFLCYLLTKPLKNVAKVYLYSSILFICLAFVNVGFGYYRYVKDTTFNLDDLLYNSQRIIENMGVFKSTDARGPMTVVVEQLHDKNEPKMGQSYLQLIYLIIPKNVWSDRPLDLAEEFARQHMQDWSEGRGLGYANLIEGYVNFGIFGVLFNYFITALLWGTLWKFVRRVIMKRVNFEYWLALYFTIGTYLIFSMHRNTFAGTFKGLIIYVSIFVIAILLGDLLYKRKTT